MTSNQARTSSQALLTRLLDYRWPVFIGLLLFALGYSVYDAMRPDHPVFYTHFLWLADAFNHGRASVTYPIPGYEYLQDFWPLTNPDGTPTGQALLPFPPLPAVVLMPFVALFGVSADQATIAMVLGALGMVASFWMVGRLKVELEYRALIAVFAGLGTSLFYSSVIGTTWFFAHLVAVLFLLAAIGIALGGDSLEARIGRPTLDPRILLREPRGLISGRMFLAGLLFGLAVMARSPILLGAPFFIFAGSGRTWLTRSLSAGVGALIPVIGLFGYYYLTTGHLVHPGYEYLYLREAYGYPDLHYHPTWSVEDIRYVFVNIGTMLFGAPNLDPTCAAGLTPSLWDKECSIAVPEMVGQGLLFSSPAWLIALVPIVRQHRLGLAAGLSVALIMVFDLAHFSQGWVQFGQRFALDWMPFGLVLLGLAMRSPSRKLVVTFVILVALSITLFFWGVTWGVKLGW